MPHEAIVRLYGSTDIGLVFHDVEAGPASYLCNPGRLGYYVALGLSLVTSDVPDLEALVDRYRLGIICYPYGPISNCSALG